MFQEELALEACEPVSANDFVAKCKTVKLHRWYLWKA